MKKNCFPVCVLLGIALVMASATGCQKDPLTLPARLQFAFGFIPAASSPDYDDDSIEAREGGPNEYEIDEGYLTISSISFEGRRRDAEDFFFDAPMNPAVVVDLEEGESSAPVAFDIPQGIYQRMEFIFEIGSPEHLPLVLTGTIDMGEDLEEVPLRFEYEFAEPIRVVAKGKEAGPIVLQKDHPATVRLEIDASFLFRLIHPGMIATAQVEEIDDDPMVIINSSKNPELFNMVAARIGQSFKVTIE